MCISFWHDKLFYFAMILSQSAGSINEVKSSSCKIHLTNIYLDKSLDTLSQLNIHRWVLDGSFHQESRSWMLNDWTGVMNGESNSTVIAPDVKVFIEVSGRVRELSLRKMCWCWRFWNNSQGGWSDRWSRQRVVEVVIGDVTGCLKKCACVPVHDCLFTQIWDKFYRMNLQE